MAGFGNPQGATTSFNMPSSNTGGEPREIPPPGAACGLISGVYYLGNFHTQSKMYGDKIQQKLFLEVMLENRDSEGKHFQIYRRFTASMYGQSLLKQFVQGIAGMTLPDDWNQYPMLLWTPGRFIIEHDDTGRFANIISASPTDNGYQLKINVPALQQSKRTSLFSIADYLTDNSKSLIDFARLPAYIRWSCMKSMEWEQYGLSQRVAQEFPDLWEKIDPNRKRQAPAQQQASMGQQASLQSPPAESMAIHPDGGFGTVGQQAPVEQQADTQQPHSFMQHQPQNNEQQAAAEQEKFTGQPRFNPDAVPASTPMHGPADFDDDIPF